MSNRSRHALVLLTLLGCNRDPDDTDTDASSTSSTSSTSTATSTSNATEPTTGATTDTTGLTSESGTTNADTTTGPAETTTGAPVCDPGVDACGECAAADCCAEKTACQDDPDCRANMLCLFETCSEELLVCRSECNSSDNDVFFEYAGCLIGTCTSECPRCTRAPDHDVDCEFLERMPEAWDCPSDSNLQGPCSQTATATWDGFCCPLGYDGATSVAPL